MIYRNDITNKKAADTHIQQYMPATGAIGGMPAVPYSIYQPMNHNGMGMPIPAAGAVTTSGPAAMPVSTPSTPSQLHGVMPTSTIAPGDQVPSTVENTFFTPGFLRTQIGRRIRVEFLLGTNLLTDRTGTLVAVGASYIVLKLVDSDDLMMCDIYSIKFVTILL